MQMHKPSLLLACLLVPFAALAHHSPAAFDPNTVTVIEGTVTEYKWGNPHGHMAVQTTGPGGRRFVQDIELAAASVLLQQGVARDLLHAGDRVSVRAHPNRSGPGRVVLGLELIMVDGSRFALHPRAMQALRTGNVVATSIAGTWLPQPEGFRNLLATMQTWPTTAQAKKVLAGDRSDMRANQTKCVPAGPPFLMVSAPISITVGADTVTFDIDDVAGAQTRRIAHLDAKHPTDLKPSLLGHSVGHWDGKALIVDTLGFTAQPEGMGFEFPSSTAKHIVERFSLSNDHKHVDYEIRIEDPTYLATPVTHRSQWNYRPGQKPSNVKCDPASARRFLDEK